LFRLPREPPRNGFRVSLRVGSASGPQPALVSCPDNGCGRTHTVRWPGDWLDGAEIWLVFGRGGSPVVLARGSDGLAITACEDHCS